ncbi:MAG: hypothetical protein LE169_02985 [Endomicrobium sp.]|nr:hypothetical protein [Endomicrobium sp.]
MNFELNLLEAQENPLKIFKTSINGAEAWWALDRKTRINRSDAQPDMHYNGKKYIAVRAKLFKDEKTGYNVCGESCFEEYCVQAGVSNEKGRQERIKRAVSTNEKWDDYI